MNKREFKTFNEKIKKIIYLLGLFKINFNTLIFDEDIKKFMAIKVKVQQEHKEKVLLENDLLDRILKK